MSTVIFFHAHPDDEAIFTALTMRRLADRGHRVVLVVATAGELGVPLSALAPGESVGRRRLAELERSATLLGVDRLVALGARDSGVAGDRANRHRRALARAHVHHVAKRLADICSAEGADALVYYDRKGIYGHPDHVAVHRIGAAAAAYIGVTGYEVTVDQEYLHFVDRHVVEGDQPRFGRPHVGTSSVEITTAIQASDDELSAKWHAMAAHSSQIPPDALVTDRFGEVYGLEWYVRRGPAGVLETLGNAHVFG